jgi:hypothetical protein
MNILSSTKTSIIKSIKSETFLKLNNKNKRKVLFALLIDLNDLYEMTRNELEKYRDK